MSATKNEIQIRKPSIEDGLAIYQLIAHSPPLDLNSIYSYYLLSDHFRDSCVVAESQDKIIGFLSAYQIPQRPQSLFVWQMVVDQAFRGKKIAWKMLNALLQRYQQYEIRYVEATVNPSNVASRKVFERLADEQNTLMEESSFLEASAFGLDKNHERECLLRVPLSQ